MQQVVRESWVFALNRECQVFIGELVRTPAPPLRQIFAAFHERIPEPISPLETTLLRGRLLDLSLRWGEAHHQHHHRAIGTTTEGCRLRPTDLVAHAWRDGLSPRRAFELWSDAYARHFSRHHKEEPVWEVVEALKRNPSDSAIVPRVAVAHGLTVRKLRADFRARLGVTVHAYQTRCRVQFAVERLLTTNAKVNTVANDAGWMNRKDMIRAIRRVTGRTPSEIRSNPAGDWQRRASPSCFLTSSSVSNAFSTENFRNDPRPEGCGLTPAMS